MKKKLAPKHVDDVAEMRDEYDFSGGVRGKHYKAMQDGYTIKVHKADGTIVEKSVAPEGTVTLAPDVREYFPTSEDVNHALRTLIAIVPQKGRGGPKHSARSKPKTKPSAKGRAAKKD